MLVNVDFPVPASLSNQCNDGFHRSCREWGCECLCHTREPKPKKELLPDAQADMIAEHGTIDIKHEPLK
jgi:hypothetical protein